jgi:predicted enzyme related to lactoylglutathione lyase
LRVHYLEIVASDVDAVCAAYEAALGVTFGSADPLLGGARTAPPPDGGSVGVRGPLRDTEEPVVRPYWLVDDIEAAIAAATKDWAFVAHPPLEILMRMMRAQQSGARRLPHFVSVPVAHKTGDFPPVLANDAGVMLARSGPIVIAFFANAIEGSYGEAEDRIGRIAQPVVSYFDGAQ